LEPRRFKWRGQTSERANERSSGEQKTMGRSVACERRRISGCRVSPPKITGAFAFGQIFRFEIPGILCDEWNTIFTLVGQMRPRSSRDLLTRAKFRAKIYAISKKKTKGGLFAFLTILTCF